MYRQSLEPRLRQPGLSRAGPRLERYRVPAQGVVVVNLERGDRITVIDPEGMQPGAITAFDTTGAAGPGPLGLAANGDGIELKRMIGGDSDSASASNCAG